VVVAADRLSGVGTIATNMPDSTPNVVYSAVPASVAPGSLMLFSVHDRSSADQGAEWTQMMKSHDLPHDSYCGSSRVVIVTAQMMSVPVM